MTLGEAIKRTRERKGLTQDELARLSSRASEKPLSKQSVISWEKDRTEPNSSRWHLIEDALGWARGTINAKQYTNPHALRSVAPDASTRVPFISYVTAGAWKETVVPFPGENHDEFVHVDYDVSRDAFALEVEGDSMAPMARQGDLVVVEPSLTPKPGDWVVAKLDSHDAATLKKYRPRGTDINGSEIIELSPINDDWPTLQLDSQHRGRIVGVVCELRRRFRRR